HVRLHNQRARQRNALLQAAGEPAHLHVAVKAELCERGGDAGSPRPSILRVQSALQRVHSRQQHLVHRPFRRIGQFVRDVVVFVQQRARVLESRSDCVEHARARIEYRLLRHIDGRQRLRAGDQAIIGLGQARDDFQQRRLARTIAADQADPLAGFDREIRVIEQRDMAKRKLRADNGEQRHRIRKWTEKIHCTGRTPRPAL
ncbi:hypothetical protein DFQ30_001931, partial [Apophysomyces sp. BC1015]